MDPSVPEYLATWCPDTISSDMNYASSTAQRAFQDGVDQFASHLTHDPRKVELVRSAERIDDIQALASESFAKYADERKFPGVRKWLQRAISKMHHYANIMDVFVQHHPEYVALAWGAMKLVLVAAQNHENTLALLSKALSQIADSLPRVQLASILYPTERMVRAVGNLYASILRFFVRAHDWSREGRWKHLVHSLTRPVELRYKDLLDQIAAESREIDQLATSGAQVGIYKMTQQLSDVVKKLESFHALHSSSMANTNRQLTDLQFSSIMDHVSVGNLGDPLRAFRFNQSLRNKRGPLGAFEATNRFWLSPKLSEWSSDSQSKMAVVRGTPLTRSAIRQFSVNMISQLQAHNAPVFWALPAPPPSESRTTTTTTARVSVIDVLKHLIFQALQVQKGAATEGDMALQCSQFRRAASELEWVQLLAAALSQLRSHQVYLVIDLSTLDRRLQTPDGFSWLAAFHRLSAELASRVPSLRLKVLLLSDGGDTLMREPEHARTLMEALIPVIATQPPVRRRKQIQQSMGSHYRRRHRLSS